MCWAAFSPVLLIDPTRFPLPTTEHLPHGVFERRDALPPAQPHESKPTVAPQASKPAPARPDDIDWREVEEEIRLAFNLKGQEVDLEVRSHVHQFGINARVEDIVEILLPKVQQFQHRSRGKVVQGHKHTIKKLTEYVTWWLKEHLFRSQMPSKPTSPYTPEQGQRGNQTQAQRADGRAAMAQVLKAAGINVKVIAKELNRSRKCVYRWLERTITKQQLKAAIAILTSACTAFCTDLPVAVVRLLKTKKAIARDAQKKSSASEPMPAQSEPQHWRIPNTRAANHGLSSWLLL